MNNIIIIINIVDYARRKYILGGWFVCSSGKIKYIKTSKYEYKLNNHLEVIDFCDDFPIKNTLRMEEEKRGHSILKLNGRDKEKIKDGILFYISRL